MEQNLPIITKKFWNLVKVALFMLRKGISKSKLLSDLNMMMKRGKIASGKAIQNLMLFHHRASSSSSASTGNLSPDHHLFFTPKADEYEFSCSNSPANNNNNKGFNLPFHLKKRKNAGRNKHVEYEFEVADVVMKAIEMLKSESSVSVAASPALPGFGKSPVVRQLRVTDSPFPLNNVDGDNHVDEAAEKFIKRFYKNLKKQNSIAWGTPGR
ncbi:hypothetical protein Leryth_010229 [Lithospermum erythrorhizon]|nr:hypothetical protein Leryth_010229 [Lithospermum erythrorhizon]